MIEKKNSTVQVDLAKLTNNLRVLHSMASESTSIMAVIKADAYGHGAVQLAKTLEPKVEAFAVNCLQEGIELREEGIAKPILVFEVPQQEEAAHYRVHNLTATVSARQHFDWLPNGTSYHLNFDTGMGRLGFKPEEAKQVSQLVSDYNNLFCTGIYSHFATADGPNSEFVKKQCNLFQKVTDNFPNELTTHIANTGATAFYENHNFDMVRLGIGLYGYPPGDTEIDGLEPIMEWKSSLVQVKPIGANAPVSYGSIWEAPEDGYLGIIPVGYSDGLKRILSEKIVVQIDGDQYPLVGRITMNYCMVFLGDDVFEPNTSVNLLYPQNDARKWAKLAQTIPYEILTSISPKMPRTYLKG